MKRPRAHATFVVVWLASLASFLTHAGSARADGARDAALDAPAPPTLPALAHRGVTYTFELTGASILQPDGAGQSALTHAVAYFAHNEVEVPLVQRRWYIGFAHDLVGGAVPGVGRNFFLGNPEIFGRGLWSSVLGLSSGGGLGIVFPMPRELLGAEDRVLSTVRVVRPWDAAYFSNRTLTLRPWLDIRHLAGRLVLQLRQGIDTAFILRERKEGERWYELSARATAYVGYRIAQPIGLGLEIWETYQLTADIPDERRAATSISPSVRVVLPRVEPAFSLLIPISTPLRGDASSYVAARVNVSFTFDSQPR